MSLPSSESSFWPVANKLVAVVFAVGAAYWPAAFIYGGTKAIIDRNQPKIVVAQAATTSPAIAATASPSAAAPATAAPAPDAALAAQMAAGQQVFMTVCFACHQPTGMGLPGMFPPLAGTDWVNAPKPDRIIRNVLHGVMGPININGKPFTTPAPMMPPQGAALTNDQIANVLTYVRNSWGNKASAVTAQQVSDIREAEKARTIMWSEADLLKIPDR